MNATCTNATVSAAELRDAEWSTTADAAGPILRRAAAGAVLPGGMVQISFDQERGEYVLGLTEH